MIQDKAVARTAIAMGEAFVAGVHLLLRDAQQRCTPEEFEAFRKGVGISIGTLHMRLIEPLYRAHPDLMPENYELPDKAAGT